MSNEQDYFIPLWPGPQECLTAYKDGWAAYGKFFFEAARQVGKSKVADPTAFVPAQFRDGGMTQETWCMGWCEHMAASIAHWEIMNAGETDPAKIQRHITSEINAIRASYLWPLCTHETMH